MKSFFMTCMLLTCHSSVVKGQILGTSVNLNLKAQDQSGTDNTGFLTDPLTVSGTARTPAGSFSSGYLEFADFSTSGAVTLDFDFAQHGAENAQGFLGGNFDDGNGAEFTIWAPPGGPSDMFVAWDFQYTETFTPSGLGKVKLYIDDVFSITLGNHGSPGSYKGRTYFTYFEEWGQTVAKAWFSPSLSGNMGGYDGRFAGTIEIGYGAHSSSIPSAMPSQSPVQTPEQCCFPSVIGFTIVSADGTELANLVPGDNSVPFLFPLESVNIRVEVQSCESLPVDSVEVSFDGSNDLRGRGLSPCENYSPYTIFGDPSKRDKKYQFANYEKYAVDIPNGQHSVTATAFVGNDCCGCGLEVPVTAIFQVGI